MVCSYLHHILLLPMLLLLLLPLPSLHPNKQTDEERGRRIAAQWTNDPAAAGPASVREQQQQKQQQQQGNASKAAAPAAGLGSWFDPRSSQQLTASARESRAAAGVGVSRWANVVLWAVLAAGCVLLGGGRLLASVMR
jgi:hypothetical protein